MCFNDVRLETDCRVRRVGDHMVKCSRAGELAAGLGPRNICSEEADEKRQNHTVRFLQLESKCARTWEIIQGVLK